jgi:hypothetical protein
LSGVEYPAHGSRFQRSDAELLKTCFANWAEALHDLPSTSRVFLARCRYRLLRDVMSVKYLNTWAAHGSLREALPSIHQISFSRIS